MKIQLGNTFDDEKKIVKTFSVMYETDCKLLVPCDIHKPILQVQKWASWGSVNYAYIPDLNRYYFIRKESMITGNRIEYELEVDVLKTYESELLSVSAFIERQENVYHPFYVDNELPIRADRFIEVEVQAYFPVSQHGNNFVLTTF